MLDSIVDCEYLNVLLQSASNESTSPSFTFSATESVWSREIFRKRTDWQAFQQHLELSFVNHRWICKIPEKKNKAICGLVWLTTEKLILKYLHHINDYSTWWPQRLPGAMLTEHNVGIYSVSRGISVRREPSFHWDINLFLRMEVPCDRNYMVQFFRFLSSS